MSKRLAPQDEVSGAGKKNKGEGGVADGTQGTAIGARTRPSGHSVIFPGPSYGLTFAPSIPSALRRAGMARNLRLTRLQVIAGCRLLWSMALAPPSRARIAFAGAAIGGASSPAASAALDRSAGETGRAAALMPRAAAAMEAFHRRESEPKSLDVIFDHFLDFWAGCATPPASVLVKAPVSGTDQNRLAAAPAASPAATFGDLIAPSAVPKDKNRTSSLKSGRDKSGAQLDKPTAPEDEAALQRRRAMAAARRQAEHMAFSSQRDAIAVSFWAGLGWYSCDPFVALTRSILEGACSLDVLADWYRDIVRIRTLCYEVAVAVTPWLLTPTERRILRKQTRTNTGNTNGGKQQHQRQQAHHGGSGGTLATEGGASLVGQLAPEVPLPTCMLTGPLRRGVNNAAADIADGRAPGDTTSGTSTEADPPAGSRTVAPPVATTRNTDVTAILRARFSPRVVAATLDALVAAESYAATDCDDATTTAPTTNGSTGVHNGGDSALGGLGNPGPIEAATASSFLGAVHFGSEERALHAMRAALGIPTQRVVASASSAVPPSATTSTSGGATAGGPGSLMALAAATKASRERRAVGDDTTGGDTPDKGQGVGSVTAGDAGGPTVTSFAEAVELAAERGGVCLANGIVCAIISDVFANRPAGWIQALLRHIAVAAFAPSGTARSAIPASQQPSKASPLGTGLVAPAMRPATRDTFVSLRATSSNGTHLGGPAGQQHSTTITPPFTPSGGVTPGYPGDFPRLHHHDYNSSSATAAGFVPSGDGDGGVDTSCHAADLPSSSRAVLDIDQLLPLDTMPRWMRCASAAAMRMVQRAADERARRAAAQAAKAAAVASSTAAALAALRAKNAQERGIGGGGGAGRRGGGTSHGSAVVADTASAMASTPGSAAGLAPANVIIDASDPTSNAIVETDDAYVSVSGTAVPGPSSAPPPAADASPPVVTAGYIQQQADTFNRMFWLFGCAPSAVGGASDGSGQAAPLSPVDGSPRGAQPTQTDVRKGDTAALMNVTHLSAFVEATFAALNTDREALLRSIIEQLYAAAARSAQAEVHLDAEVVRQVSSLLDPDAARGGVHHETGFGDAGAGGSGGPTAAALDDAVDSASLSGGGAGCSSDDASAVTAASISSSAIAARSRARAEAASAASRSLAARREQVARLLSPASVSWCVTPQDLADAIQRVDPSIPECVCDRVVADAFGVFVHDLGADRGPLTAARAAALGIAMPASSGAIAGGAVPAVRPNGENLRDVAALVSGVRIYTNEAIRLELLDVVTRLRTLPLHRFGFAQTSADANNKPAFK
jgi:hypothetical protein